MSCLRGETRGLYAGATMEEAGKWLTVAGALCGEMQIANGEVES